MSQLPQISSPAPVLTATIVSRAHDHVPQGAIGIVSVTDAVKRRVRLAWVSYDATTRSWTNDYLARSQRPGYVEAQDDFRDSWIPVDRVEFLDADTYAQAVRDLHARCIDGGRARMIQYVPPCGHRSFTAAYRDLCDCLEATDCPEQGSVAVVSVDAAPAAFTEKTSWANYTHDRSIGPILKVDPSKRAPLEQCVTISADELVGMVFSWPRPASPAMTALGLGESASPDQQLMEAHTDTVLPGFVSWDDAIWMVIDRDEDGWIVAHRAGASIKLGRGIGSYGGINYGESEDTYDDSEGVPVVEAQGVLQRIPGAEALPVTLSQWLRFNEERLSQAYHEGYDDGDW